MPVDSIPTSVTFCSANQSASISSCPVIVANVRVSERRVPPGPGRRTVATTVSRCTSMPAHRSINTSIPAPLPRRRQEPPGVGNLSIKKLRCALEAAGQGASAWMHRRNCFWRRVGAHECLSELGECGLRRSHWSTQKGIRWMQLSHARAAISARFDDPNLVSCAGLLPVMALAQRCGLATLLAERLTITAKGGANAAVKILAIVAGMVGGADSIADLDLLRHGGGGPVVGGVPGPPGAGGGSSGGFPSPPPPTPPPGRPA